MGNIRSVCEHVSVCVCVCISKYMIVIKGGRLTRAITDQLQRSREEERFQSALGVQLHRGIITQV